MANPYIGEIRLFAGAYAPIGWAFCDGSILAISENEALFQLIGTTYGGDGQQSFALPDLRGRAPVHQGTGGGGTYVIGARAGVETVTLSAAQAPAHSHAWGTAATADTSKLSNGYLANGPVPSFATGATVALAASTIASSGGGAPHENMAPFLTVNFIISLFGIYPTQA